MPEIIVNPPSLPLSQGVSVGLLSKTSADHKKSPQIKGESPVLPVALVRNTVIIKVWKRIGGI